MSDIVNSAINWFMGGQPEPVDWELKRRADEQRVGREEAGSGAHPKLIIEYNGQERHTQLSTSPRVTGQAIKYKLSDVKRMMREMG